MNILGTRIINQIKPLAVTDFASNFFSVNINHDELAISRVTDVYVETSATGIYILSVDRTPVHTFTQGVPWGYTVNPALAITQNFKCSYNILSYRPKRMNENIKTYNFS